MPAAVHLDGHPPLKAEEIKNIRSNRVLATKPVATEPTTTQVLPEDELRLRGRAAQVSRAGDHVIGGSGHSQHTNAAADRESVRVFARA